MKSKEELNELMHWLAYNYPGVYVKWSDYKNQESLYNIECKSIK